MDSFRHLFHSALVLFEIVLIFNLMIAVHELGHFLAAKWRGMKVEAFAIWFGRPLWHRRINGVDYRLGCVPLGGYVRLPEMVAPRTGATNVKQAPPLDRIIVALAGPLFSLLMAGLLGIVVWIAGRPTGESEASNVVGCVPLNMPAEVAPCDTPGVAPGLRPGDHVLSVDGLPVTGFGDRLDGVAGRIATSTGARAAIEVERGSRRLTFHPRVSSPQPGTAFKRRALPSLEIVGTMSAEVAAVKPGSPGAAAGLQVGDRVVSVNGQRLYNPANLYIVTERLHYGEPLRLEVDRRGGRLATILPPMALTLAFVYPGSPAERVGLQRGNQLTALNGQPLREVRAIAQAIQAAPSAPLQLTVAAAGQPERVVSAVAQIPVDGKFPVLGVEISYVEDGIFWRDVSVMTHPSPTAQIRDTLANMVGMVKAMTKPKSPVGVQQFGGPVMIANTYYQIITGPEGWRLALCLSVFLNVNLALMNLLPLPILDGGLIGMAILELVRRKPLSFEWAVRIQGVCMAGLFAYMLYITFYDVGDMVPTGSRHYRYEFAPVEAAAATSLPDQR